MVKQRKSNTKGIEEIVKNLSPKIIEGLKRVEIHRYGDVSFSIPTDKLHKSEGMALEVSAEYNNRREVIGTLFYNSKGEAIEDPTSQSPSQDPGYEFYFYGDRNPFLISMLRDLDKSRDYSKVKISVVQIDTEAAKKGIKL